MTETACAAFVLALGAIVWVLEPLLGSKPPPMRLARNLDDLIPETGHELGRWLHDRGHAGFERFAGKERKPYSELM